MKIGITYTGQPDNGSDEKQQNYINWLKNGDSKGFQVVTLHAADGIPPLDEYAGVIFSGGIDVSPSFYGQPGDYPNAPATFNATRDEFEKTLFEKTQELGVPVLGICRGMQLVNVLSGGTLKQDLGVEGNDIHRAIPSDKKHQATVEPGTILMEIAGEGTADGEKKEIAINSAHHQVIDKVGKGLKVTCYSSDGVPEGLERESTENGGFLLCVQWHPERMFRFTLQNTPACAGIRDRFLQEIKKYSTVHENL